MAYRDELEAARHQIDSLEKSLTEEEERYSELEKREYYLRNELGKNKDSVTQRQT